MVSWKASQVFYGNRGALGSLAYGFLCRLEGKHEFLIRYV